MRQVVAVVKPFWAQNQRNEKNLHLPSNLSPSLSRVVSLSPAPSIIDLVSVSEQNGDSDNEGISSRSSYSQGMHTSGDDTDTPSMDIGAPPSMEKIPQELAQMVEEDDDEIQILEENIEIQVVEEVNNTTTNQIPPNQRVKKK